MPKGMQPIYRQVLSGAASEITFNNIPQTYTDLKIVINGRTNAGNAGTIYMRINGMTTGYNTVVAYGEAVAAGAFSSGGFHVGYLTGPNIDAASTGSIETYIPNYQLVSIKNAISTGISEGNATTYQSSIQNQSGISLLNPSTVTSLTILNDAGVSFTANTSFSLYGIGK
jgi:hypothetical protein